MTISSDARLFRCARRIMMFPFLVQFPAVGPSGTISRRWTLCTWKKAPSIRYNLPPLDPSHVEKLMTDLFFTANTDPVAAGMKPPMKAVWLIKEMLKFGHGPGEKAEVIGRVLFGYVLRRPPPLLRRPPAAVVSSVLS